MASIQTVTPVQTVPIEAPFSPVASSVEFQARDYLSSTPTIISVHKISFEDPRKMPEMVFELHLRDQLPKSIPNAVETAGRQSK